MTSGSLPVPLIKDANMDTDASGRTFRGPGVGYFGWGSGTGQERAELRVIAEFGEGDPGKPEEISLHQTTYLLTISILASGRALHFTVCH